MMTLSSSSFQRSGDAALGHCRVCGAEVAVERTNLTGQDAPCTACGHRIWFQWEPSDEVLAVQLGGEGIVTEQNIMRILGRLDRAIREEECRAISLNFGPVTHVTSTTLAHLVGLKRRLDPIGGRITLTLPQPELHDIFRITRLDSVFSIGPNGVNR